MSLADPFGFTLTSIRDDAAVAAWTTRVRGGEPMGRTVDASKVVTDEGDARGPGKYVRFIVLSTLGRSRLPRAPLQEVRISARCYGLTFQDAAAGAAAVSDAIHAKSHRISPAGVVVFTSFDDGGEGAAKDPDTAQPYETVILQVNALTSLLP